MTETIYTFVAETNHKTTQKNSIAVSQAVFFFFLLLATCILGIVLFEVCWLSLLRDVVIVFLSLYLLCLVCAPKRLRRGCVLKANARKAPVPSILTHLPFTHDYQDRRGFMRL